MSYLLFLFFLLYILGSNLFSPGHYVLFSKEVMGPKCRQRFIANSPGRDNPLSKKPVSSPSQTIPLWTDSLYSSWPPRAQPPLNQARARDGWGLFSCHVLGSLGGST